MMPSPLLKPKPRHKWTFEAIGTSWSIETSEPLTDSKHSIITLIEEYDRVYSRFRSDSLVSEMAASAGTYDFPTRDETFLTFYGRLYEATDGAVSPLVGSLMENAGYDRNYSFRSGSVVPAPGWESVMEWDGTHVIMKLPWVLDFGASGKGYLIDLVCEALERAGHERYVVDASGDIRIKQGDEVIGLEHPYDPTSVIGVTTVRTGSICASAINRRAWGQWHHVVDPRSAKPVRDIIATWVMAPTAMVADGIATALFFSPAEALAQWEFEYVRLHHDGAVERSDGFVGELYI